jgi:plastocyanin
MMSPVLLNQRIQNSSNVIEGKVINQISFWDPSHQNIYTSNLIEVYKTFKNTVPAYIEVISEGGTVGNDKEIVHPSLELSIGEIGVFTLNQNVLPSQFGKPVFEAYASSQGFIKYNVAENEATEPFEKHFNLNTTLYNKIQQYTQTTYIVVKPTNPFLLPTVNSTQAVAAITGFSPTTITAGTFSVITINGSGFGTTQGTSFVEFKRADDGGATFCRPDAWSYVLWSDTQIQVKLTTTGASTVNSTPGSGVIRVDVGGVKTTSTASLTVTHAQINVYSSATAPTTIYNTRHVAKQSGGYNWQMFTGFDSNAPAKASFLRAFQSWRCGTYINWNSTTTNTVNTIANDGVNVIRFDIGTELPSGVLGRCTNRFSGCGTQPNQTWFVNELDIVFDDATNWNFGPAAPAFAQYDFESVAVHELGHGHELGHVINSAEIMNFSLTNGQQKRTLSVNDLAGGNAVMARNLSGGVCAIGTMTALTVSNCALGAPTASFTANRTTVCPGETVIFTNLSTGTPTLLAWTFAGGTPSTSAVSNPTITYNTPGTYSVQLVATNANGSSTYSITSYINVTSASALPLVQDFQSATFPPTNWYKLMLGMIMLLGNYQLQQDTILLKVLFSIIGQTAHYIKMS